MKITFLVPVADLSGGARVVGIYAREMSRRGHEVRVVIARRPVPSHLQRAKDLLRGRVRKFDEEPSHYDGISDLVMKLQRTGPITADDCPDADVIIATWWETAEWMMAMPSSKGRKVHFVQHYEAFEGIDQRRVDHILRLDILKITISKWLSDLLVETFRCRDVQLVPNGVSLDQFNASPRVRNSKPSVGMLYHNASFKNVRGGLIAFNELRRRFPESKLVSYGAYRPSKEVPLPEGSLFYFQPAQEKMREIYAQCDVWICSSHAEGFHLPPLEAMACRCPVISTPVGGPADIIVDGLNGFLVPLDDAPAMAARLIDFFEAQPAEWLRMSNDAYRTALARDWHASADMFERSLLNKAYR